MKIKLSYDNGSFEVATTYNGELIINISDNAETMKSILKSVYQVIDTKVFLSTLDSDQLCEVIDYCAETDATLFFKHAYKSLITDNLDFEDVMNYYGVSAVCEWCEANR